MNTIDLCLPCWHDGCTHQFHLQLLPEDVTSNNVQIAEHLVEVHDGAGLVRAGRTGA